MRALDYLHVASKGLRHKPLRSVLTISALTISTLIFVALVALSYGTRQVITSQLGPTDNLRTITVTSSKTGSFNSVFGNVQVANQQNSKLTDATVSQLAAITHVQFASPRSHIWEFNTFQVTGTTKTFVAQAEGVSTGPTAGLPLSAGQLFTATADSNSHDVIIGEAYASQLGFGHNPSMLIGKTINITTQNGYRGEGAVLPGPLASQAANDQFNQTTTSLQATIVGVTTSGANQNSLFIPEPWARAVRTNSYWQYDAAKAAMVADPQAASPSQIGDLKSTDQIAQDGYTSIVVEADSLNDVSGVTHAIDQLGYGEVSLLSVEQRLETFSTIVDVVFGAIALVALIAALLGIVNTLLMVVAEQQFAIGVWRACGASKKQILWQFLTQSALVGLWGGLLGALLGYAVIRFVDHRVTIALQSHNLLAVQLSPPTALLLIGGVLLTILFSLVAGLYPASAASRADPSRALAGGQ